jgi:hypothetical protein
MGIKISKLERKDWCQILWMITLLVLTGVAGTAVGFLTGAPAMGRIVSLLLGYWVGMRIACLLVDIAQSQKKRKQQEAELREEHARRYWAEASRNPDLWLLANIAQNRELIRQKEGMKP